MRIESHPIRSRGRPLAFLARYLLALLLFNLSACSTYQAVSVEKGMRHSPPPGIEVGSLVKVTTLDRKTDSFRVMEITDEGLGGNTGFYRYENMKTLKVDRPEQNKGEWVAWFWGIVGVAALVALIGSADSVRVCSPPCESPQP